MHSQSGNLHSDAVQSGCPVLRASKTLLAAHSRTEMNVNTLNRTVLAALIGSALAVGLGAPNSAQARQTQEESSQESDREAARLARQKAREERAAARGNAESSTADTSQDDEQARQRAQQEQQRAQQEQQRAQQ